MIQLLVVLQFALLSGCASSEKKAPTEAAKTSPAETSAPAKSEDLLGGMKVEVIKADPKTESASAAPDIRPEVKTELNKIRNAVAEAKSLPDKHLTPEGVDADKALGWLKNGNTRYLKGFLRNDGQSKKDIQRLSSGQKPHSIILSCSDSRVPPEVIFDQKLGEIFVVRTAGESLDPSVIASIEYAAEHLGSKLIVVMGHTSCGAVKATLESMGGADLGSPHLNHLASDIMPRIKEFSGKLRSSNLAVESYANAKGAAKDLILRSAIIRGKFEKNEIKIVSALYDLDSGKVDFE